MQNRNRTLLIIQVKFVTENMERVQAIGSEKAKIRLVTQFIQVFGCCVRSYHSSGSIPEFFISQVFKALKLKEIRCDTVEPLSATIVSLLYRSEYSVNIGPEVLNPLYIPCYVQGSCDGRNAGEAAVSVLSNATSRKELNINKTYLHSSISCRLSKKQCLSTGNGDCLLMYIFFFVTTAMAVITKQNIFTS